jgi:hypothetical protein
MSYRSHHDMGGLPAAPVKPTEHDYALWEKRVDAILMLLRDSKRRILTVDELRRGIESILPEAYDKLGYYERWISSLSHILVEKGVIDRAALDAKLEEVKVRLERERG